MIITIHEGKNKLLNIFVSSVSLTDKVDFMLNPAKSEKRKQDMERAYQSARDATNIHSLNLILFAVHIS